MTEVEETAADLWATGLDLGRHPTEFVRRRLTDQGVVTVEALRELPHRSVEVAGIVTHRQQPDTAKGVVFVNLEDETGLLNVICTATCGAGSARSPGCHRRSSCGGCSSATRA